MRKKNRWLMRWFAHDKSMRRDAWMNRALFGEIVQVLADYNKVRATRRQTIRFAAAVLLIVLACLPGAGITPVQARENPLYTIQGVEVDVSAETAAEAKKEAITQANVKAFSAFAERVGGGQSVLEQIAGIAPRQINAMLDSLSIEEERTGPGRYIGKLTVRFLPDKARALMNRLGVSYSEKLAGRIVVVPVWKAPDGSLQIWENNPWRSAWLSLRAENALVPVIVPLGDLTDTTTLTTELVAASDQSALEAMRLRYDAEAVLVSVAEPLGQDTVQATMAGDSPVGLLEFDKGYTAENGGGIAEAAQLAARRFHEVMLLRWKKQTEERPVTSSLPVATLPVAVSFFSSDEWSALRNRILATPGVSDVDISTIAQGGAIVQLSYVIGFEQLRSALWSNGMALQNVGGTWVLQTN